MPNETLRKPSDLKQRFLVHGIVTLFLAFFIFLSPYFFTRILFVIFIALVSALALWEYYQLVKKKNLHPAVALGVVTSILYTSCVFLKITPGVSPFWSSLPEGILVLSVFTCFLIYFRTKTASIANISTTFFGLVYIAVPLSLIVRILYFPPFIFTPMAGSFWLLYLMLVTKGADMGGYFVGRNFGKRKLALRVSPNKTLEGAMGGLLASIALSFVLYGIDEWLLWNLGRLEALDALWLGALLGIFGQLGDLAESLLKRDAGVKDSNILPGVGGVLDMVDSLLFTAPIVYMFLKMRYS